MMKCPLLLLLFPFGSAFVVPSTFGSTVSAATAAAAPLLTHAMFGNTQLMAAATVDPTSLLSDVLGGIITSPAILAVPVLAALAVAFLIGFIIFAYATPQVEDDE